MYVFIYLCMYVCMQDIYVYVYVCIYMYISLCVYIYIGLLIVGFVFDSILVTYLLSPTGGREGHLLHES